MPRIAIHCAHDAVVALRKLSPNPANPNKHPDAQVALLAKIIKAQGWRNPIVVSKRSGLMTKGHARLEAARKLGAKDAPVDYQDYGSEKEELADMIADNRIAELAEADRTMLRELAEHLDDGSFDMDLTGFDSAALEELMTATPPNSGIDAEPQIDKAEELAKQWRVKQGQVWELGEHRLACADCLTYKFQDAPFDLLCTDPPYGVSYADKNVFLNAVAPARRIQKHIEKDHQTPEQMSNFWKEAFTEANTQLSDRASYYTTGPQGGDLLLLLLLALRDSGFQLKHMLIWAKNNHVLGRCNYHYKHEPILFGWKINGTHDWHGGSSQFSLWEIDKPQKSDLHPTTKPVELFERAILNSTRTGQKVFDPFVGSGTTIIACERTARKCRAIEITPGYTAVSIQRWADATGKTPRLLK